MVEFIKMTPRKKLEQENQNRPEQKLLKVGVFFIWLLTKLAFREINNTFIGILSLLIVNTNSLAIFQW